MKILIFTEGTILMHPEGASVLREGRVQQVKDKVPGVKKYSEYVAIGDAPSKIAEWINAGHEVYYLTSRTDPDEIQDIQAVLDRYKFPKGKLLHRKEGESYGDVAEQLMPDIIIEDNCESIGGQKEMTWYQLPPEVHLRVKLIPVPEFAGIDHLPSDLSTT